MSECTCHKNYTLDTLIPKVGVITDIRQETPDVKTFRVNAPEGGKLFEHMPGQCAMVCAPGVSEGMFSITSSPTNKEYQEFSIKKCGALTDYLHSLQVGDEITVRGPVSYTHLDVYKRQGLYLYRGFYNLGIMSLSVAASWFASAILIIAALPLGLIFARILTDKAFRYCT